MPWTTEQKIFIVKAYFKQKSIHAVQLQFKEGFGCREFPVHSVIYRWVNKFRTHGTVHNLNRKDTNKQSHSGRPKSSRTPHNVAAVRDSVVHSPSKSVRRRSQELGINRESVRRILISDLHMYPYRIQMKQKLTPEDMRKRVIMCQWFCDKIDAVPDFLGNVWFSDEAHFDPEWSPHSPDFNPQVLSVRYLKDRVYGNNPQTIPDLKAAITAAIRAIPRAECGRVIESFARRIQMCLQRRGAHL